MSRSGYPTMQNMQNQIMNQPPQVNNILQVMGPESARAFKIGPDSQVILMDSNEPIFYIKVSDSSGYSKTKAFKFEEISFDTLEKQNNNSQKSNENYITKEDFDEYKKFIEDLVMKNG